MTQDQWWAQIEEYIQIQDWNGMAVCADGLEEADDAELADTLRWIVRQRINVRWVAHSGCIGGRKWYVHLRGNEKFSGCSVKNLIQGVQQERQDALEYWQ